MSNEQERQKRLRKMQQDPEAALRIGMHVLRALVESGQAESYFLAPDKVRTRPVEKGDHMDVKGGG